MYQVIIKTQGDPTEQDFFTRKRDVIRFIAKISGVTQASIKDEVDAQGDSIIYRDNEGWRAEINYS
jgi:hypothetical protein